jgi:prohibitin 1
VIFDRFAGVKPEISGEGTHFLIPWVQKPIIFDIRSTPRQIATVTGSKGWVVYLVEWIPLSE